MRSIGKHLMLAHLVECLRLPSTAVESMSDAVGEEGLSLSNINDCSSSLSVMSCVVWFAANNACNNEGSAEMLLMHSSSSDSLVALSGFGICVFSLPLGENPRQCCLLPECPL